MHKISMSIFNPKSVQSLVFSSLSVQKAVDLKPLVLFYFIRNSLYSYLSNSKNNLHQRGDLNHPYNQESEVSYETKNIIL